MDADQGLALLTVDDPGFWKGLSPAAVSAGTSANGRSRSSTPSPMGRTSRHRPPAIWAVRPWGRSDLVALKLGQLDTKRVAMSDVVASGATVLGLVATVGADDASALSARVLADFLTEAKRPTYRGYSSPALNWEQLKSATLREELGLGAGDGGVRITRVAPLGLTSGALAEGDVLFTIDGIKVHRDGTCDCPGLGRLPFVTVFSDGRHPGDTMKPDRAPARARRSPQR